MLMCIEDPNYGMLNSGDLFLIVVVVEWESPINSDPLSC